jgi:hypothetical protein
MATAEAPRPRDWSKPPFGLAPIGRFLQVYNRQLSRARPAMEEWWVFGGFLDELAGEEERRQAEAALCRLAAASAECFDRVCSEVEALAAPAWHRRMRVQIAATLDEVQYDQTGARLAALAVIAAQLGWQTGDDTSATGFGTRRTCAAATTIDIRVGGPRLIDSPGDAVDLDFILTPDESASVAVHGIFRRLADLTAAAAEGDTLVDLPLRRRLELLRRL